MNASILSRILTATLLASLVACGGGGGHAQAPDPPPDAGAGDGGAGGGEPLPDPEPEPEPQVPTAKIHFPPPFSQTDADAIAVRGVTENLGEADQLLVNGIATQSDDDFATWSVELPLELGANEIRLTLAADGGGEDELLDDATVERIDLLLGNLRDLTLGAEDHLTLVLDSMDYHFDVNDRIVEIDTASGTRRVVSQDGVRGEGPNFKDARGLVFDPIAGGQIYFMCDGGNLTTSIYKVEYTSGDRSLYSGPDRGLGPVFEGTFKDMVIDEGSGTIYVAMSDPDRVFKVNWSNGDRTVISALENEQGIPPIGGGSNAGPDSLAWDHLMKRLFYTGLETDPGDHVLVQVDLESGHREVISDELVWAAKELTILNDGSGRAFFWSAAGLFEANLDSGDLHELVIPDGPSGPPFSNCEAMTASRSGDALQLIEGNRNALVSVDTATGECTDLMENVLGTGTSTHDVSALIADATALVVARSWADMFALDLSSGERSPMASFGLCIKRLARGPVSGQLYLATQGHPGGHGLFRMDPSINLVQQISGPVGDGWTPPLSLVIDDAEKFAYVLTWAAIERIDLETGERSAIPIEIDFSVDFGRMTYDGALQRILFTKETWGEEVFEFMLGSEELRSVGTLGWETISGLVMDADQDCVIAAIQEEDPRLVAMDIETGVTTTLSSAQVGRGPRVNNLGGHLHEYAGGMDFVAETRTVFVTQPDLNMILAIDSVSGDRVIVAR